IAPRTNPARIAGLADLARPGIKLVIGAEAVPVGAYTRETIRRLAKSDGFAATYASKVMANVVSEEENVKSLVRQAQLAHADVPPLVAGYVHTIPTPAAANVIATYPIAVAAAAEHAELAQAFVERVLSPEGQRALERHQLLPAAPPSP